MRYMRWFIAAAWLLPLPAAAQQQEQTVGGMGEAAAHAARAAVRGSLAGHGHPTLARSGRRDDLLHLSADHGGAFATDRIGLCAIRPEHDRLDELSRSRTGRRGARDGRAAGDDVTAKHRHRHSSAPNLAFASVATSNSGRAAAISLGCPSLLMLWTAPPPARECHGCGRC